MAKKQSKISNRINWDFIEPLFRMGGISNCEITSQYAEVHKGSKEWKPTVSEAAIRKQAKAKGWVKNLAGRVKEQISEKLVRTEVRDSHLDDDAIVDQAAKSGANVVLRHRKEISSLAAIEGNLLVELEGLKKTDKTSLKDKTIILKNIAHVRAQRIALEREAYNLDNDTEDTGPKKIVIKRKTRDNEDD